MCLAHSILNVAIRAAACHAWDARNGTGPKTLEEALKFGEYTVSVPYQNDQSAPYFMILVGAFIGLGVTAAVFFIKGRSGKYTP